MPHSPLRVLLLSASAGAGHLRAADALLQEFKTDPRVTEVQHWDMLAFTNPAFRHLYSKVYLDLVNRAPKLLGWIYENTDTPWGNEKQRLFEKFNARPFIKAVLNYKPDRIVCTHFTPANIVGYLHDKGEIGVAPNVVVTDLDCHSMWLTRTYQQYFVALDETREYLTRVGIRRERIGVTGIPIDPKFRQKKPAAQARRELGLAEDRCTLLVSAGGFGVGPVEVLIQELLRMSCRAQVVVIAGKSVELKGKLERLAATVPADAPVQVFPIGFTTQMHDYMAAADLLLGKPGGLTTSEAMAMGLPMCIVNPIPGQEERNSDHLLEVGAAVRCNTLPVLGYKLEKLLATPGKLDTLRRNAAAFGKPNAAADIVQAVLGQ